MPGVLESTIYRVETQYAVTGTAARGFDDIARSARGANEATGLLKRAIEGIGLGIGIDKAKHALIDFNAEVQNAKISLSTMLQGNYGVSWEQATAGANSLYSEFQRFSQLTPVTTQEMLEFGRGVAVATAQAGGGIRDITKITEQGVVAAKAMGAESSYASLELTEMLQGNVSRRMRFAQQLLGMAHTDEKKFKAMSGEQRLALVETVLDSPAMKNATNAFSTSFTGVLSTLEDKLQILFGKVGLPLFKAITAEVSNWSAWLDKNQGAIDRFSKVVADDLVSGFRSVKTAVGFVVDHADVLIGIAKAYAAAKGISLVGGAAGSIAGTASGLWAKYQTAAHPMYGPYRAGEEPGSALSQAGIGGVTTALAAGYALGTAFMQLTGAGKAMADAIDPMAARLEKMKRSADVFDDALLRAAQDVAGKSGAAATITATNLAGATQNYKSQLETLRDIQGRRYEGASDHVGWAYGQKAKLEAAGFDPDQVKHLLGNESARTQMIAQLESKTATLGVRGGVAAGTTDTMIAAAMATMTKEQRNSVDVQKGSQLVMQKILFALSTNTALPSMKDIKEILTGDAKDPFSGQAKFNQNITNNIQVDVAAKDPDRWIAELDAKVQRKIRAPSQARASIITRGGQ